MAADMEGYEVLSSLNGSSVSNVSIRKFFIIQNISLVNRPQVAVV